VHCHMILVVWVVDTSNFGKKEHVRTATTTRSP
jgi:hypothetical protein